MKKVLTGLIFFTYSNSLLAQGEVGPDGDKLIIIILVILILALGFVLLLRSGNKKNKKRNQPFFTFPRISIELNKDRVYFPDVLEMKVRNRGNIDLDLDRPLLIFENFWLKRKFRLNGMQNRTFYPLYLEKGQIHSLDIDINRFYHHDKSLKKFPKAKIVLFDVKGKRLGSKSVYLRKTLFKF